MNMLIIPIRNADEYALVTKFIETNMPVRFEPADIDNSFFNEKGNFDPTYADAIAVDFESAFAYNTKENITNATHEYKEIEPTLDELYKHVTWPHAA